MDRPRILDRFRPAGAPGPAGPVGIPAVDSLGPAAELAPVFAALGKDIAAAGDTVRSARQAAQEDLARAREQAAALVAQARIDAAAVRARAAAGVLESAAAEDARLLEESAVAAAAVKASAAPRLPGLARGVIERILAKELGPQP